MEHLGNPGKSGVRVPRKVHAIFLFLAYGLSGLVLGLQFSAFPTSGLFGYAQPLVAQLTRATPALIDLALFAFWVLLLHFGPVVLLVAAHKRLAREERLTPFRYVSRGVGYVLAWHLFVVVVNAIVVPRSIWAIAFVDRSTPAMNVFLALACGLLLATMLVRVVRIAGWPMRFTRSRWVLAAIVGLGVAVPLLGDWQSQTTPLSSKPDIIVIGIDSLSRDQYESHKSELPNIRRLMEGGLQFADTLTPLGRTFSAWTAILSGRYPNETGAEDNLYPLEAIDTSGFLPARLKRLGYTTVFGIDERQFSNIDESYGFDRIVGPRAGVADFVLSKAGDIPAVNLALLSGSIGQTMFPYIYLNRAAAHVYRPERFSAALRREVAALDGSPLFLAVHFCLAHVPYTWGEPSEPFPTGEHTARSHMAAIKKADEQVGSLLQALEAKGRLRNAIVVVLSDHGEATGGEPMVSLGAANHVPAPGKTPHAFPLSSFLFGHGSNLNVPEMVNVLLGFSRYEGGRPRLPGNTSQVVASLVDVAPTVLELATGSGDAAGFSGRSLASVMANGGSPAERNLFMETGFSPVALNSPTPEHKALIASTAHFLEINANGRLQFKLDSYDLVKGNKERAVVRGKWQLTLYASGKKASFLLFDRHDGRWTDTVESPLWSEAGGDAMLRSLAQQYGRDVTDAVAAVAPRSLAMLAR